jgi:predicted DsbA family dithiol-disulfide isomerase
VTLTSGETPVEVVEFTDPACSWAWGTEPKLRLLRWRFGDKIAWRRVLGGLVEDLTRKHADFDPVRLAVTYKPYWQTVYTITGMSYPVDLKWMAYSTEPAGRAVKAAELQSDEAGGRVLRRLREQTFIFGEPADTPDRIVAACNGVEGLDMERFAVDIDTDLAEKAFREDFDETRRPNSYVLNLEGDRPGIGKAKQTDDGHWRFVFPTVLFRSADKEETVPGWCDYDDYELALEDVAPGATDERPSNPTPEVYFDQWPTATERELAFVCGPDASPPKGTVSYDWGEGTFYLTPKEAAARGL